MAKLFLFVIALMGSGCATTRSATASADAENKNSNHPEATQENTNDPEKQVELKVAKLWAKVDELEDLISKQKQRISVLEKGLMLGIIPDELKNEADLSKSVKPAAKPELLDIPTATELAAPAPEKTPELAATTPATKTADPAKSLAEAQKFFEQGQYGRALAIYSGLEDQGDGSNRYWIGMCWFKLKEFETAHKEFSEFLAKQATGPWAPRAKFNLAQIDFELGYKQKALDQMRSIIKEYPEEDAAQMARASIAQMEANL